MMPVSPRPKQSCVPSYLVYVFFFVFPVVTFIWLQTDPWLPDGSPCDPNLTQLVYVPLTPASPGAADEVRPVGRFDITLQPCTCHPEFPVVAAVVAGMETCIFVLFVCYDPLTTAHGLKAPATPVARYGRIYGAIAYFAGYIASIVFLGLSSTYCGFPIFLWTFLSAPVRGLYVFFTVAQYETSSGEP